MTVTRSGSARGLTSRQLQILRLIADGHIYKEIARELHIAPRTVKTQMFRIFNRLSALNGPHAVAIAMRDGMIDIGHEVDVQHQCQCCCKCPRHTL